MMPPPQRPRRASKRTALLIGTLLAGLVFVYPAFFIQGRVLAGRDAFRLSIPDSALLRELLGRFELPLWNPYLYLGQPFAGTLQSQAFYPPHLLTTLLFGPVHGYTVGHVLHAAIGTVGAYWLCRRLRCSPIASAFAAAAFGLSPLFADLGGLRNIASSAAWTGCLLAAAHRLARAPSVRRVGLLAVFAALSFLCGSPETLIWQAALALLLINALGPKRRTLASGIGAFAWAVGLAAVVALPAVEFALHSTRGTGRAHPLAWSTSWAQLLSLVWPFADQPRGAYWGPDQWLLLTLFVGSCTGLLGLVALRGSRRLEPFVLGVILFGALALGAHLAPSAWLLTHPPLHLFRYPAKYLVGVCFCLAVLAAFGLDRLAVLARRVRPSPLRVGLVLGGTMGLLAALLAVTRFPPFRPGAQHGALWLVLFGAALATAFFAIPDGPRRSRRVRAAAAIIATLELIAVHLTQVGAGWAEPRRLLAPSALANALPRPFEGRISLDVYGEDHGGPGKLAGTSVMEASRDALIPNRHLEERLPALEGYGAPEPERVPEFHLAGTRALFDLAGVTAYVRAGPPPFKDLMEVPVPPGLPRLYRSTTALPRAFVVQRAVVVPDSEALGLSTDEDQPARRTVYLASGEPLQGEPCNSTVRFTTVRANTLELDVDACAEGYLVLADAHYPGWKAEVDGKPTPVLRADYALRAVRVPQGPHRVSFRYRPASFAWGAAVSAVAWGLLGFTAWRGRRGPPGRTPVR